MGVKLVSFTLLVEHKLRMFENRLLRRIFGTKREELVGGWRILCIEKLHNLYASPKIIHLMKSRMGGGMLDAWVRPKTKVKKPYQRPRCRWESSIRMDLREV